jgi:hypothetical protein
MFSRMIGITALLSLCLIQPAASQPPADSTAGSQVQAAPPPATATTGTVSQTAPPAAEATPAKPDHVTAVKESFQKSMTALRQYQWIETTIVSLKGEEKSRTQNTCSYGPDGKVLKTPLAPKAEEEKKKGLRGKAVEKKKGEISDATKEAIALVKQYVPPDPARIGAAKTGGRVMVSTPDPAGIVRVAIKDYVKAGDSFTLEVNGATDQIAGLTVATFTEKKDPVGLKVAFGALPDGTIHAAKVQLDVPAQDLTVTIENANYKKPGV